MPEQPNGRTVEVMASSGAMAVPERRDPSAATLPVQWVTPGQAQPAAWDASRAFKQGYSASVWVNRCVSVIATTIASLPFRAGLDPNDRSKVAENARLSQLLGPPPNGPAPGFSARRWWTWLITQYLVTGRFAAEIDDGGGAGIAALWPMPSAIVSPVPSSGGTALFSSFKVKKAEGTEMTLRPDRVLYHYRPSGTDIREAESVLQAAQLPVSVDVMLGQYTWSFLRNDARPAAVIVTPQFATDDDFDEFASQFIDRHAGPWNAGKVAFVEASDDGTPVSGAIDVKNMGLSQKDAQMLETHQAAAEAICVALGVPMSILDASGRTYSNAGEEKVTFFQNTILPLLADLEDAINTQIAPRVGREVGWFDTSSIDLLQPPAKFDPAQAAMLVDARLITPNEARSELGLEPLIGGYSLLPAPEAPPAPDPEANRSTTVVHVHGGPDAHGVEGTVETRARQWKRVDQQARVLEQSWVGTLQGLFEKQRRTALATLTGKKHASRIEAALRDGSPLDMSQVAGVFDQARWRSETSTVAEDLYRRAIALGLDRIAASDIGISFDLSSPWATQLILDRANMLAGHVTSTTYAQVQQALTDGVAEGEGIKDIARRVEAVFDQAVGQRAEVIARTEVISASNGAVHEVAKAAPDDVVGGKEWIAAEDERTRDSHASADGQIVAPTGMFDIGGSALRFPGDPAGDPAETINCRCVLALVTPKEMPK